MIERGDYVRVCGPVDPCAKQRGHVIDAIGEVIYVRLNGGSVIQRKRTRLEKV